MSSQYEEPTYEGFLSETITAPDFNKDSIPHNQYKCLECSVPLNKAYHRSHSDISISNENLAYGNVLSTTGSSNSLSPATRSRSHTFDSAVSSSGSVSTTPQSQSSKPSSDVSTGAGKMEAIENGEEKLRKVKSLESSPDKKDKKPKSPLVRMKRVTSESSEVGSASSQAVAETESKGSGVVIGGKCSGGAESESRSGDGCVVVGGEGSKVLSPAVSSSDGRDGSSASGDVEGEGGGGAQEVMINVIRSRYVYMFDLEYSSKGGWSCK